MDPGTVAGSIHADRKRLPRRKLTLKDRISALDKKIERARALLRRLEERRVAMLEQAREQAQAALAEAEAVK